MKKMICQGLLEKILKAVQNRSGKFVFLTANILAKEVCQRYLHGDEITL
jgi:hypothetical protein